MPWKKKFLVLQGDATDDELLIKAGIARASSLISGLPNDAANVFITLTARNLNRDIQSLPAQNIPARKRSCDKQERIELLCPPALVRSKWCGWITRPTTAI